MKRKDFIKQQLALNPEDHIAVSDWCCQDVLNASENLDLEISKEEANDIIDGIHREFLGGGTIDWGVITEAIEAYVAERVSEVEKLNDLYENHPQDVAKRMVGEVTNRQALVDALAPIIRGFNDCGFDLANFNWENLEALADEVRDAAVKIVEKQ